MTDNNESYLRDLEAASVAVGTIPDDYGLLRDLLENLPPGTPPDVRAGRTGVTSAAAGTGGLDASAGMTIQSSTPIGSESGAGLGIDQQQSLGLRNFFIDSRLTSANAVAPISILGGASVPVTKDWAAVFTVGATGIGIATIGQSVGMDSPVTNPTSTSLMQVRLRQWTAAGTANVKIKSTLASPAFTATVLPFVVFSVVVYRYANNVLPSLGTGPLVTLKIRNAADAADLAVSTPLDFFAMTPFTYRRMWVAMPSSLWNANVIAQIQIDFTTVGSSGGAGDMLIDIGDPQWELASYQSPSIFLAEPPAAKQNIYLPTAAANEYATRVKLFSDGAGAAGRIEMGLTAADEGAIKWSSGAAAIDVQMRRTGAGIVAIDNPGSPPNAILSVQGSVRIGAIPFLQAGTAFPGAPATNEHFYRTNINGGMWFHYDGTRWLSDEIFEAQAPGPTQNTATAATTSNIGWAGIELKGGSDAWLLTAVQFFFVNSGGTALAVGTQSWSSAIDKAQDSTATFVTIATALLNSGANGARLITTNINALMNNGTIYRGFRYSLTKVGTPGSVYTHLTISYQIVAT